MKTPANDIKAARKHHLVHGDMDDQLCLLAACALHYPHGQGVERPDVVVGGAEPSSEPDTTASASEALDRTSGAK